MTVTYALHQTFRYQYDEPISHLRHRLVVLPPALHGDQRRLGFGLTVTGAAVQAIHRRDRFGNHVVDVVAPAVDKAIEFTAEVEVCRKGAREPAAVPTGVAYFGLPSALTRADRRLADAARELAAGATGPLDLAERAATWVHGTMRYGFGVTNVRTTAAEALAAGAGVCQDYAHVMLALLRSCGVPARYVSGHLLGEGGTHAWVDVLVEDAGGGCRAVAFDPTHDREASVRYVTVAVGRDYADVPPTSGTYHSGGRGSLTCRKRLHEIHETAALSA